MASPPHDLSAEQAALGCVLLGERDPLEFLTERDFYRPTHQLIFRAMQRLDVDGAAIDALTLSDALGSDVDRAYLLDLTASVSTSRNWRSYADILRRKANGRHLVDAGTRIAALGYDGGEPSEAAALLEGVGSGEGGAKTVAQLLAAIDLTEKSDYIETDIFPNVHMRRGDVVVVGSRPSVGKSAVGVQIARAFAEQGHKVLIFTYEMSDEDYLRRFIHAGTGINRFKQDDGLTPEQDAYVRKALGGDWKDLVEVDNSNPSVHRMRRRVRQFARDGGMIVIIDHFHLLVKQSYDDVTEASRALKLSANDSTLKTESGDSRPIVIALAQLSRKSIQENGRLREPGLGDLRQSGAIEQDADIGILLHHYDQGDTRSIENIRSAGYLVDEFIETRTVGSVIVAKNRNGKTKRYPAWFSGDDQHWSIMDRTSDKKRAF